ncbi:MAG: glycosyltransferase N-terminal domain-containing protein [Pseudomonadota bacterium]
MAAYSIGLTLYNLSQRQSAQEVSHPPRPAGRLVWLHAPTADAVARLAELARRLVDEDGFEMLMTCPDPIPVRDGLVWVPPPADIFGDVSAFLDHWRPEIVAFSGGELRPALVIEAHQRKIPLIMIDAGNPYLLRGRDGWYPGLTRSVLSQFSHIYAQDEEAARAYRKAGAALSAVAAIGRLEEQSAALPCLEAERDTLARLLLTRPVWFAATLPETEENAVIAAHKVAIGLAHKSLLIVSPATAERAGPLTDKMTEAGLSVAVRANDDEPDPETEVYVIEGEAELGLWYRLAPITYLGGSLSVSGCIRNPLEAAALGSAIVHGPNAGRFEKAFSRLTAARATRLVGTDRHLAEAVSDVLAPDKAARLAQAAWIVASDGAEVAETIIATIRDLTDGPG